MTRRARKRKKTASVEEGSPALTGQEDKGGRWRQEAWAVVAVVVSLSCIYAEVSIIPGEMAWEFGDKCK